MSFDWTFALSIIALAFALFVLWQTRSLRRDDALPNHVAASDSDYWRHLREAAEAEQARLKADHDRTGKHRWLDVTIFSDAEQRFICQFCEARDSKPFEDVTC